VIRGTKNNWLEIYIYSFYFLSLREKVVLHYKRNVHKRTLIYSKLFFPMAKLTFSYPTLIPDTLMQLGREKGKLYYIALRRDGAGARERVRENYGV
jgi:hypothetical protein